VRLEKAAGYLPGGERISFGNVKELNDHDAANEDYHDSEPGFS